MTTNAHDKLRETRDAVQKWHKSLLRQIVREEMMGNKEAQMQTIEQARKAKADLQIMEDAMGEYRVMLKNNELKEIPNE